MAKRVALDGMIRRADFGEQHEAQAVDLFEKIGVSNIEDKSPIVKILRKPDFQRETNHWTPDQVSTFISSFARGELIPSLILWKSSAYIFVIDGGHRLSALQAWIEDDYGDGWISHKFYGGEIPDEQKAIAKRTRALVHTRVGKYTDFQKMDQEDKELSSELKVMASNIFTRGIPIQWIKGNPEVAESSFFKINTQGTPLDKTEELLLRNRHKSYAISARSVVRAGTGHKYWSTFSEERKDEIEKLSHSLFNLLFQPEIKQPIKTLDLPLGGTVSPVEALKMLIDMFAIIDGSMSPSKAIDELKNDEDGSATVAVLNKTHKVISRMTGNDGASLGLHPAVYFYNEHGRHSRFFFLGTLKVIAGAVRNNDKTFFRKFTESRKALEKILIQKKSIINQGLSNVNSEQRIGRMEVLIVSLVDKIKKGERTKENDILLLLGLEGKLGKIKIIDAPAGFSNDTKSAIYLDKSLRSALLCPICSGYIDTTKAVSYDHIVRKQDGGLGHAENGQLTHPYCNTGMKS